MARWESKTLEERFWEKVLVGDDCWVWTAAKNLTGYGTVRVDGVSSRANRIAYILAVGPIPDGLVILHICNNPSCVRPAHLTPGTQKQNAQYRKACGRQASHVGVLNGRAKLTCEQAAQAKSRVASGETIASVARAMNVSWTAIKYIVSGRNWNNVQEGN